MWYWKINEGVSQRNKMLTNQEEIISLLKEIKKSLESKKQDIDS